MVIRMSNRGSVTLPPAIRKALPQSALFEVVRRDDGVIELRPQVTIDASQAWFWTERWQRMEREADESYARGDFRRFESGEEFLAHLEELDREIEAENR